MAASGSLLGGEEKLIKKMGMCWREFTRFIILSGCHPLFGKIRIETILTRNSVFLRADDRDILFKVMNTSEEF